MDKCVLTGYAFKQCKGELISSEGDNYLYKTIVTGLVNINKETYNLLLTERRFGHHIITGMCRSYSELNQQPPTIDTHLVNNPEILNPPKTPKEKIFHFIKLIYDMGGKDLYSFDLQSTIAYPLFYAKDGKEFNDLIKLSDRQGFIYIENELGAYGDTVVYQKVRLTDYGIDEVEKIRPRIPMREVLAIEFFTGEAEIDEQIAHAKRLFIELPKTIENLRSACEQLCFIVEPIRKKVKDLKDLDDDLDGFLNIANNYVIRHNKATNKPIQFEEQYDFIFYGLLNSILFYSKIKNKLNQEG